MQLGPYIAQQLQGAQETHPDATRRSQYLRSYIDREYGEQLVAIHQAPFAAAIQQPGIVMLLRDAHTLLTSTAISSRDPRRANAMLGTVKHPAIWANALTGPTLSPIGIQLHTDQIVTQVLETSYQCPHPTLQLLLMQANWEVSHNRPDLALHTYEVADRMFDAPSTIPPRIRIAKAVNQPLTVTGLQVCCMATGDYGLINLCSQASKT